MKLCLILNVFLLIALANFTKNSMGVLELIGQEVKLCILKRLFSICCVLLQVRYVEWQPINTLDQAVVEVFCDDCDAFFDPEIGYLIQLR